MTPADLVYDEVFTRCTKAGCSNDVAKNAAVATLEKYKKNQFTKVSKLIESAVVDAKKLIIKKKKR